MPFVSDAQLTRIHDHIGGLHHRIAKATHKASQTRVMQEVKVSAETIGVAAFLEWAKGQMEARNHSWTVFGFDSSLVIGAVLVGGAYMGVFKKYNPDALNAANGILAVSAGRWAYQQGHSAGAAGKLIGP